MTTDTASREAPTPMYAPLNRERGKSRYKRDTGLQLPFRPWNTKKASGGFHAEDIDLFPSPKESWAGRIDSRPLYLEGPATGRAKRSQTSPFVKKVKTTYSPSAYTKSTIPVKKNGIPKKYKHPIRQMAPMPQTTALLVASLRRPSMFTVGWL